MVTLNELTWTSLPCFLACIAAVWGMGKALFRSLPAELLKASMMPSAETQMRIRALQRDLERRGESERAEGIAELKAMARIPLGYRPILWLLNCVFCQNAWAALLAIGLSCSWHGAGDAVLSVFAYAAFATIADRTMGAKEPSQHGRSCPTCGGGRKLPS